MAKMRHIRFARILSTGKKHVQNSLGCFTCNMKFLYLTLPVRKDCKFSSVLSGYGTVVCQISYIF
jgi:hypothetical protein